MHHTGITRRDFGLLTLTAAVRPEPLTALQCIERLQKNLGIPWRTPTVDTFKAGDPGTPVHGIATTFMATLDVMQRAFTAGRNLVITHEPTFYSHEDQTAPLANDPVYRFKRDFIAANRMVVFRFHDHLHLRKPDFILAGIENAFAWQRFVDTDQAIDQRSYVLPPTTLGDVARHVQSRLGIRALRVVGDPQLPVTRAAINAGYTSFGAVQKLLGHADILIAGEMREWEGVEYTQDAISAGMKKGLILLGHQASEEPGMQLCADWLHTFIPEVPVEWIPTREPFWRA
jgi:putative NIF3 family GTP cyclohydrolase 1 type 2